MNLMEAHNQWKSRPADQRFETLQSLRDSVHGRRIRSRAKNEDITAIRADVVDGNLILNSRIAPSEPNHWSFGQLATWLKAPASYLRTLPINLTADCLNNGIKQSKFNTLKFMSVERNNGPDILQAVTSTTYGRIWDADVVDMTGRLVERSGGRFHNPLAYTPDGSTKPQGLYASDRDVFIFMIDGGSKLEVHDRAKLNRGFIIWNSEVGNSTFGMMLFMFNEVCGNHIIWGASDVSKLVIRHTKNGPARFDSEAFPQLMEYCESSTKETEDTIRKASDMILGSNDDEVIEWLKKTEKFSKREITEGMRFAKVEEGDCRTLWQVVQGLTEYARGFEYVDSRIELETRAGNLLKFASN